MAMKMPWQRLVELQENPNDRRHGTKTGVNLGCRCHACEAARKVVNAERREKARYRSITQRKNKTFEDRRAELILDPTNRKHGTVAGAKLDCPCPRCRKAAQEAKFNAAVRERENAMRKAEEAKALAEKVERIKATRPSRTRKAVSKDVCTVPEFLKRLMGRPNIDNEEGRCCWCGAPATNKHHIVKRSAGKLVVGGKEVAKPTIRLCGEGNASGCHAKAHAGLLHFKWVPQERGRVSDMRKTVALGNGHWMGLETEEPMKYQDALECKGWRRV